VYLRCVTIFFYLFFSFLSFLTLYDSFYSCLYRFMKVGSIIISGGLWTQKFILIIVSGYSYLILYSIVFLGLSFFLYTFFYLIAVSCITPNHGHWIYSSQVGHSFFSLQGVYKTIHSLDYYSSVRLKGAGRGFIGTTDPWPRLKLMRGVHC
jgi:hypothetical protein